MHNEDCDDDGLYQGKKRKEVNYLDVLVDRVIYYLDDDYMSECYETNKKFYDEFTKMVTNAIYNGWKESYLTDLGKGIITEKFLKTYQQISLEVSQLTLNSKLLSSREDSMTHMM